MNLNSILRDANLAWPRVVLSAATLFKRPIHKQTILPSAHFACHFWCRTSVVINNVLRHFLTQKLFIAISAIGIYKFQR